MKIVSVFLEITSCSDLTLTIVNSTQPDYFNINVSMLY